MSLEHAPALDQVSVRVLPDGRLDRKNSAAYLGVSEKTMAMWHLNGKGPVSILVGGRRFCFLTELVRFVAEGDAE